MTEAPGINILVSRLQGIQIYTCVWLASLSPKPCAIKPASCFQAFFFPRGVSLLTSHPGAALELGTARAPVAIVHTLVLTICFERLNIEMEMLPVPQDRLWGNLMEMHQACQGQDWCCPSKTPLALQWVFPLTSAVWGQIQAG